MDCSEVQGVTCRKRVNPVESVGLGASLPGPAWAGHYLGYRRRPPVGVSKWVVDAYLLGVVHEGDYGAGAIGRVGKAKPLPQLSLLEDRYQEVRAVPALLQDIECPGPPLRRQYIPPQRQTIRVIADASA